MSSCLLFKNGLARGAAAHGPFDYSAKQGSGLIAGIETKKKMRWHSPEGSTKYGKKKLERKAYIGVKGLPNNRKVRSGNGALERFL